MPDQIIPTKISHVAVQTYDIPRSRDWYCKVLNGAVVHERLPIFSTVSYDDEHHRIAIVGLDGTPPEKNNAAAGFRHACFIFKNISTLLARYEQSALALLAPAAAVPNANRN